MGIKEDAGKLLVYIYRGYIKGKVPNSSAIETDSKWDSNRIRNAINYLSARNLIETIFFLGGNFIIKNILPDAIDAVEDKPVFLGIFGFEVDPRVPPLF